MKGGAAYKSELRAEQVAATRQRIVAAAVEMFAPWATELPFDKVAERTRVSVRTVYRHFPSQRDLLKAVTAHYIEHSGWKPDELTADTLGAMTAYSFAYLGTMLKGHKPEKPSPELKALRKQRLGAIERALRPLTARMDADRARGILAVVAGLTRLHFLRGMHEHWGLDGATAGRAVEWAINTLLDALRRQGGTWDEPPRSKARRRKRT